MKAKVRSRKASASTAGQHHKLDDPTMRRHQDDAGKWVYDDPATQIASLDWEWMYRFRLAALDDYLGTGWDTDKARAVRVDIIKKRGRALSAHARGDDEATEAWLNFLHCSMQLHASREALLPLARKGSKFTPHGRGAGPVKALVRVELPRLEVLLLRKASHTEIWRSCASSRDPGLTFVSSQPWGKPVQIQGTTPPTSWARFRVIVSEVRAEQGRS